MIKINLLPEEYKRKKINISRVFNENKTVIKPVIVFVSSLIVIPFLFIFLYPALQNSTVKKLERRFAKIEKEYQAVSDLKKEEKKLNGLLDDIKKISEKQIVWAEKLNIISDCLPVEIQLTEVSTRVEKTKDKSDRALLVISGQVPSSPGERAIGEFIKGLSGSQSFSRDFPQIEPPSTQSGAGGLKIFTIKCYRETQIETEKKEKEDGKDKKQKQVKGKDKTKDKKKK